MLGRLHQNLLPSSQPNDFIRYLAQLHDYRSNQKKDYAKRGQRKHWT